MSQVYPSIKLDDSLNQHPKARSSNLFAARDHSTLSESAPLTVACLFSGIGGFARALETSGVSVRWVNEKDSFATETFRLNFPETRCICRPVQEISVQKDSLESVDILTAGFPCQPFSVAGKKEGLNDVRGQLFTHIVRLIEEFGEQKPKILLLENVKNFRHHDNGRTFQIVQSEIQRLGYWFSNKDAAVLNTLTHTNIPQNRERVFMAAFSANYFTCNTFQFPTSLPSSSRRRVQEFLDLDHKAPDEFYFTPDDTYYPLFEEALAIGNPESVYLLRRSYVRENKSGVCYTLMANMGEGGHNEPVIQDAWGIRKLTPTECARLQGFDDEWFKIPKGMSRSQIGKQIGNSVTVPIAERLVRECVEQLRRQETQMRSEINYEMVFSKQ